MLVSVLISSMSATDVETGAIFKGVGAWTRFKVLMFIGVHISVNGLEQIKLDVDIVCCWVDDKIEKPVQV